MDQRWTLPVVAILIVAFASPAAAASGPFTIEDHANKVLKVAPQYPTVPGKTLCVCQTANATDKTYVGYLNAFIQSRGPDLTLNLVCAYPSFPPGQFPEFCALFEVIK
jgi:hypothetical protein